MTELPDNFFDRQDESPDELFYEQPRFVTHIDDATIAALTAFYQDTLTPGSDILDLMSSWISHLPEAMVFHHVAGLGMNAEELDGNPRLDTRVVQNLNQQPELSYEDASFDAVLIAVSVQYLARPFEVFSEIARVLRPGGRCIVAMSHRLFPTKAILAFQALGPQERCQVVGHYMHQTSQFDDIQFIDRSPPQADPLWIMMGTKLHDG